MRDMPDLVEEPQGPNEPPDCQNFDIGRRTGKRFVKPLTTPVPREPVKVPVKEPKREPVRG